MFALRVCQLTDHITDASLNKLLLLLLTLHFLFSIEQFENLKDTTLKSELQEPNVTNHFKLTFPEPTGPITIINDF